MVSDSCISHYRDFAGAIEAVKQNKGTIGDDERQFRGHWQKGTEVSSHIPIVLVRSYMRDVILAALSVFLHAWYKCCCCKRGCRRSEQGEQTGQDVQQRYAFSPLRLTAAVAPAQPEMPFDGESKLGASKP